MSDAPEKDEFVRVCAEKVSMVAVGKHYGQNARWARKWMLEYGLPLPGRCDSKKGERSHLWKGGLRHHTRGYIQEMRPDHPYADKRGYVMQHRLVVEARIGRYLTPGEEVHHKDGNTSNNAHENLEVLSVSEHRRLTRQEETAARARPCEVDKLFAAPACTRTARHYTGLCGPHYSKYHCHYVFLGKVNPSYVRKPRTTCASNACPHPLYARGVCEKHYTALAALYPDAVGGTSRP